MVGESTYILAILLPPKIVHLVKITFVFSVKQILDDFNKKGFATCAKKCAIMDRISRTNNPANSWVHLELLLGTILFMRQNFFLNTQPLVD